MGWHEIRYRELVDKKYLKELDTLEQLELEELKKILDKKDKKFYKSLLKEMTGEK